MYPYLEINNTCIQCDNCKLVCPESSIFSDEDSYAIDSWSCTLCNICVAICPIDCIKLVTPNDLDYASQRSS